MPHIDVLDATIIAKAHAFVDGWLRSDKRRPFSEAVREAEQKLTGTLHESELHRTAFRQVANAIRVGYGHIETNPRPLVDIVRRALEHVPHYTVTSDSSTANQ